MLTKRIIPCLDIKDGKVVKGVNFVGLKDVGDPIELAKKYESIVKKLSVDDLGKHLQSLSVADATEAAHYILGNGLYHATNPKKWDEKKIAGFLKSAVFKKKNKRVFII